MSTFLSQYQSDIDFLQGLIHKDCLRYLDDVLIPTPLMRHFEKSLSTSTTEDCSKPLATIYHPHISWGCCSEDQRTASKHSLCTSPGSWTQHIYHIKGSNKVRKPVGDKPSLFRVFIASPSYEGTLVKCRKGSISCRGRQSRIANDLHFFIFVIC